MATRSCLVADIRLCALGAKLQAAVRAMPEYQEGAALNVECALYVLSQVEPFAPDWSDWAEGGAEWELFADEVMRTWRTFRQQPGPLDMGHPICTAATLVDPLAFTKPVSA